jgi:hypothetical protein
MGKKKVKKPEPLYFHFPIYGILNLDDKNIIKVSLDRDEILMELDLETDKNLCEIQFPATVVIPS